MAWTLTASVSHVPKLATCSVKQKLQLNTIHARHLIQGKFRDCKQRGHSTTKRSYHQEVWKLTQEINELRERELARVYLVVTLASLISLALQNNSAQ